VKADNREISDELDLQYWFDRESLAFKLTRGRSGEQINAKSCPSCGDTRWRVYLNAETGRGNCFVCSATFNKLEFVHLTLGGVSDNKKDWALTFQHVKDCLKDQGWRPRRTSTAAVEYGEAKLPTSFALPTPEGQNLTYLENRGVTVDLAKFFHLRYCDRGTWTFKNEDATDGWQKFDGRVIVPVFDLDGSLATFQGRDITGLNDDKKYLFPKGLPGTGRYLFNGQNAIQAKRVCMGEGAFDVIAQKIAFDEVSDLRSIVPIGSFGKHLSYGSSDGNDQLGRFLQLKGWGLEEVTIMWDGEHKALIAALDAAELLHRLGIRVRIAILPKGKDPNEVVPEVVRQAFWSAQPYGKAIGVQWRLRDPFKAA
jgi:DNA primase